MKKFVIAILVLIMVQFITISCTESGEIIQDDKTQIEQDYQKTDPDNGGGRDDDDEDDGN